MCDRREWENGEGQEVIEGSKGTGNTFHAKMGRKEENQWKYLCFLSLKSLMEVVVSCDNGDLSQMR